MQLTQSLEELKGLHEKVFGRPAPTVPPQSHLPFPPGLDPIEFAKREMLHVKELMEQSERALTPDAWTPPADVLVSDDAFVVRLELPGVSREDIHVRVVGRECIVRGERKPPKDAEGLRPLAIERPWGAFERRFHLPMGSRIDDVTAPFVDGVLELSIPVDTAAPVQEKAIEIR